MTAYIVSAVILSAVGIVGFLTAIVSWFYRRGGSEREFTLALHQNTLATDKLSQAFHSFRENVVDELHELDLRVTVLEKSEK